MCQLETLPDVKSVTADQCASELISKTARVIIILKLTIVNVLKNIYAYINY